MWIQSAHTGFLFLFVIYSFNLNQPSTSHPPLYTLSHHNSVPLIFHTLTYHNHTNRTKPSIPSSFLTSTLPISSLTMLPNHMVGITRYIGHTTKLSGTIIWERISLLMSCVYCTRILQLAEHFWHSKPLFKNNYCNQWVTNHSENKSLDGTEMKW